MYIDWNMVTAIATCVSAVAAIIALYKAFMAYIESMKMRKSSAFDALFLPQSILLFEPLGNGRLAGMQE